MSVTVVRRNPKNGAKKFFPSIAAAARWSNLDQGTLTHVVNGTHGHTSAMYGGFEWFRISPQDLGKGGFRGHTHSEATKKKMSQAKEKKKVSVEVRCVDSDEWRRYSSVTEVARELKLRHSAIRRAIETGWRVHVYYFRKAVV
jgi:hypothetical protein